MQRVAVGWLAWQMTGSGFWLGIVAFFDLFPTVALSPISGTLADRYDRLKLIKLSQFAAMVQAILLAVLVGTGGLTIGVLVVLAGLLGIVNAINQPARLALIPSLVERDTLASAIAFNSIVFNLARFIGPAAAGIALAHGGAVWAFGLNALSYVAFQVSLALLRPVAIDKRERGASLAGDALESYRYVARHPGLGPLFLILTLSSFGARAYIELLPGFAAAVFMRDASGLAMLTSSTGLGAMAAGFWMAGRAGIAGTLGRFLNSLWLLAASLLLFTATDIFWVGLVAVAIAGGALVVNGIAAQTLTQSAVDGSMRGRVLSMYGMLFRGGPALGALLMGSAATHVGLRLPLAGGAILCGGLWVWAVRHRARLTPALEGSPT